MNDHLTYHNDQARSGLNHDFSFHMGAGWRRVGPVTLPTRSGVPFPVTPTVRGAVLLVKDWLFSTGPQALNEEHRDKYVAVVSTVTKLTFCVMEDSLMLLIRAAAVSDVPLLLRFSREFAEYERQPDALVITEETLIRDGFGARPKFRSLIAEWDGQAVGYALFFGNYSSLKGSGIFLEDLFVRETFRGRGIGRALLSEVARIARQESCYGIRWEVLSWNESAIKFYKSLGGEFFDEWRQVLLQADALNRLADG